MKYRYLKITGDELIWGKNTLEKQDLIDIASKRIDLLLDVEAGKYFNSEKNQLEEIAGSDS